MLSASAATWRAICLVKVGQQGLAMGQTPGIMSQTPGIWGGERNCTNRISAPKRHGLCQQISAQLCSCLGQPNAPFRVVAPRLAASHSELQKSEVLYLASWLDPASKSETGRKAQIHQTVCARDARPPSHPYI